MRWRGAGTVNYHDWILHLSPQSQEEHDTSQGISNDLSLSLVTKPQAAY